MSRFSHVVIRASAGTGKTFQLSNRFLGLLNSGAPADRILATTFTRKAAAEILDRVILRLAQAAVDADKCGEISRHLQDERLSPVRCQVLLQSLTRNLHRLRVSTLDSFFSQIASSFALELGLPPGWEIVENLRDARLRSEAIENILRGDSAKEVTRLMNLLTKGDAQRSVSELVRSTVNNLYSLYLETTKEAWQRFPAVKPLTESELLRAMAELQAADLSGDNRMVKARDADLEIAANRDWETFISKGLAGKIAAGETTYYRKEIPAPAVEAYERLVRHARATLIDQLARQTEATYELLEKFDLAYRRLKYESRAMRFEDITRCLARAASFDDLGRLEFRLDTQLAHLLFDEFQDTSLAQWQVMRPFAERVTRTRGQQEFFWDGGQQSFFCVGDVKQAIYGWRGGKSEIFKALEANLNGLQKQSLTCSFRSAPAVIESVNRIFSRLTQHPHLEKQQAAVHAWSKQFETHSTALDGLAGYVSLESSPPPAEGEDVGNAVLRHAAQRVAEIVAKCPGRSVGVLVRRNTIVARLIFELRRLGVPASEEGGNPLTDSVAVQAVLSLLKLADHPGDLVARMHVASTPVGRVMNFTNHSDEEAADRLAADVRRRLIEHGYGPTVYEWTRALAPSCNRRDFSRLQQLVELAYQFQPIATLRPGDFIRFVNDQRVSDPTTADVRVMTVHQAKGLQFDIVVLPELETRLIGQRETCVVGQSDPTQPVDRVCLYRNSKIQSLLPDDLQRLFEEYTVQEVSESLCVLYVAITRAVHALHMIVAPSKPNEQNMPATWAGLLRVALTEGSRLEPNTIAFEHGDRNWFGEPAAKPQPVLDQPRTEQPLSTVRLAPLAGARSRGLDRATPSGMEGGTKINVASVLRFDNTEALARGTLIHAWFEQICWLDDGRPDIATLRSVADKIDVGDLNVDELLRQFLKMLESPVTSGALSRFSYINGGLKTTLPDQVISGRLRLEVQNERRFAVRDSNHLLSGTIDRLVLMYDQDRLVAADVIDFKTDSVSPGDRAGLDATVEHYRPQLKAYRSAVSKMFRLSPDRISTRLLLLGPDVLKSV